MKVLHIDLETFSSVNLQTAGVYAYSASPDFCILLMAYAVDEGPVHVIDMAQGEVVPTWLREALGAEDVIKMAYNANFERTCLARYLGQVMPPHQWRCVAVHGATLGLPGHLEGACQAVGLSGEMGKSQTGKALIHYCSLPCQPTVKNGQSKRHLPTHDLEKWALFRAYCQQDVVAERALAKRLARFPMSESEQRLWELDQRINDRGIQVDQALVSQIITYDQRYQQQLLQEAKALTGLSNPKSLPQLKAWLKAQGLGVTSLGQSEVARLMGETKGPINRVLALRQAMSKTSVKKYEAMQRSLCPDGRVRGTLQFYGANRTGRWSGRLVQVHNLPQNKLVDLDLAREGVKAGDFELVELLFGETAGVLSQLVRTAFVPREGKCLIISDFSAIEARIIAWLAGERWRLEVFETHGKIYEASASKMFQVPLDTIGKGSSLRQKGKVAELACGYQGGVGALKAMGAESMGLTEEQLQRLIRDWRGANPHIVQLWKTCEQAAKQAISEQRPMRLQRGIVLSYEEGILFIQLPSGRRLAYAEAKLMPRPEGGMTLSYLGVSPQSKRWSRLTTYGGKLCENIVQAIARDVLAEALKRLEKAGYTVVMYVHDEVVIEGPRGQNTEAAVTRLMCEPIAWAPQLPLQAETYSAAFYRKD